MASKCFWALVCILHDTSEELQPLEMWMVWSLLCVYLLKGGGNEIAGWPFDIAALAIVSCYNNNPPFNSVGEWKLQFYRLLLILCMSLFRPIYDWRACCFLTVAFTQPVARPLCLMACDAGYRLTQPSHCHMCVLASAWLSCFSLPMMRSGGERCCFSHQRRVMILPRALARGQVGLPSVRIAPYCPLKSAVLTWD